MAASIDIATVGLLNSVLNSGTTRKLFTTIAARRAAELTSLTEQSPELSEELSALENADLIGAGRERDTYYVTAKGLKVARALEQLSNA